MRSLGAARLVVVASMVLTLSLGYARTVYADEPLPATTPTASSAPSGPSTIIQILPDPRQWAGDVFTQVITGFLQGIGQALRGVVGGVTSSSLNVITRTPPAGSYASPTVQALWNDTRGIADAALVLVALGAGFNLIGREQLGLPYPGVLEVLPRLALGALFANTSLWWAQVAIDANNALCQAIGGATLPAWNNADPTTQALVDVIAALIYLITSLLLLLQMLMRLALVDVLIVAAPLGILCWILPQTQGWARLWSSLFVRTVFTQFVQVVALKLGNSLLTEVTPIAPDAALLAMFLGIAALVLTIKILALMRGSLGDGLGFVRYVTYRQGARALDGSGHSSGGGH